MPALNFPKDRTQLVPAGTGPLQPGDVWTAPTGVKYTWTSTTAEDYWAAARSGTNVNTLDSTYVRLDGNNTPMTGNLKLGAADQIVLKTDGSAIFASNVGIGTTSPGGYKLHVAGSVLIGQANSLLFGSSSGPAPKITNSVQQNSLSFFTNGSESARIDSAGNVGIGLTSISSTRKVEILQPSSYNAALRIKADGNGNDGNIQWFSGLSQYEIGINQGTDALMFKRNSSEKMRIDSSGNVGIGTSSASAKLDVSAAYNETALEVFSGGAGYSSPLIVGNASGSEYMRIDSAGRLLVGTSSALTGSQSQYAKLMGVGNSAGGIGPGMLALGVSGTASAVSSGSNIGRIFFTDNAAGEYANITCQSDGAGGTNDYPGRLVFSTSSDGASSPTERMRIDSSGRMLVGTTTVGEDFADELTIANNSNCGITIRSSSTTNGNLYFSDGISGTDQYSGAIVYAHDTNSLKLFTNGGQERVRIDSAGRLLVGLTSSSTIATQILQGSSFGASDPGILYLARGTATPSDSQTIGSIRFSDNTHTPSAVITAARDGGTWSATSKPTFLSFQTTSNGATSGIERLRIDSSGRVLIDSSVTQAHPNMDDLQLGDGSGNRGLTISSGTDGFGTIAFGDSSDASGNDRYSGSVEYYHADNSMRFYANISERMRIGSTGQVMFNRTTVNNGGRISLNFPGQTENGVVLQTTYTGLQSNFMIFRNSSNDLCGQILQNGTTSLQYTTSSDYRLKENVVDIVDGITRLKQLQPRRFNFIADTETTVDGFIAHEAQAVVPEAVAGEKDGKEMQGIDHSKLIPLLTAALQEAIAKIETLEQRLSDAGL